MSEIVVCQIPFGTSCERDALARVKDLGFTSVQIYTCWRHFELARRGKFDWTWIDRQVELVQSAGLKFVPFLLMGPRYAAPEWWIESPGHVGLRCLEHDKTCPIESVWNAAFHDEIARVCHAFAQHFLPWNVLESVQPGIGGDCGEAIFPVLGNWPGTYHTHRGYWCGGEDAKASFRQYLKQQYGTPRALNSAWRTNHVSFDAVVPGMPHKAPSRTALFDQMTWYRQSMTDYSEVWMKHCRAAFGKIPVYLCTGGADDETTSGAHFAQQAKIAAKHSGGIRLTNEGNTFAYNFPLTSHTHTACEFYGAYLGLEPVGPLTAEGVRARVFGSAAFGNRQIFHYYGNVIDPSTHQPKPAATNLASLHTMVREQPSERGIAVFWPIDEATLNGATTLKGGLADAGAALLHVRREYPASAVSEELILDGILSRFRCLVMVNVASCRAAVLQRIAQWVTAEGGVVITTARTRDIELESVSAFEALFGITGESEEAWGHNHQDLALQEGFGQLAKLTQGYHAEKGWLHLAGDVEKLSTARGEVGSSGVEGVTWIHPVAALFRRRFASGGQAIYYAGPICFKSDPQALFHDPEVIAKLLNDVCAAAGVAALGTQDDELARARIGGQLLTLRQDGITER